MIIKPTALVTGMLLFYGAFVGNAEEDAKVVPVETKTTVAVPPEAPKEANAAPTLENMDANRDGSVSKDEFIAFHAGRLLTYFNALDKDGSAALTKEELIFTVRRPPASSQRPPGVRPGSAVRSPSSGAAKGPLGGTGAAEPGVKHPGPTK